ncbi:PFL_4669 family integrating conjugative element protein [Photobacterium kishitanii]|uniref:PFL_4669 family integrating conjugative element protein n=1 Tax=Photobacterium kishitanii TaxID=318456 RepID=UPI0007F872DB|nr:TIGR03761 family integrating conjugative element protein [Photobacterium kishitanii]OBU31467.1 integrating conjugative element protein [Photobacterium kishitanii]PSW45817.1 TIGR03761 family integrating conjugative element protein [Photobacterium kishitanii]
MHTDYLGNADLSDLTDNSNNTDTGRFSGISTFQLQTKNAIHLFQGKKLEKGHSYGLGNVTYHLNTMFSESRNDCPFADYFLLHIEDTLYLLNESLDKKIAILKSRVSDLPNGFSSKIATVEKPFNTNLDSQNPLTFQLGFWLLKYDDFVRMANTVAHIGLITPKQKKEYIETETKPFRSLMHLIRRYQPSGATRNDLAAKNQRAIIAAQKFADFEIPDDVLSGIHRSEYAPEIFTAPKIKPLSTIETDDIEPTHEDNSEPQTQEV